MSASFLRFWTRVRDFPRRWRAERRARAGEWKKSSPRRRAAYLTFTTFFSIAACALLNGVWNAFAPLERPSVALRMAIFPQVNAEIAARARRQIVLVPISDDTFSVAPFSDLHRPPLPRAYHAKIIRELKRAGAKVIVFDLLFDVSHPDDDQLAAAARQFGRVVWACSWQNTAAPTSSNQKNAGEGTLLLPNPALQRVGRWGHTRWAQEGTDDVVNSLEATLKFGDQAIPALSVEAARMTLGLQNQPLKRVGRTWQCGPLQIPVDENNRFSLSYVGPASTGPSSATDAENGFLFVPYEQIFNGAVDDDYYRSTHFFRDKIVFVGDVTSLNHDVYTTPVGPMPGYEIHAHALATLLQRAFLLPAPTWQVALAFTVLAVASCLGAALWRWTVALGILASLLLLYFIVALWQFVGGNVVLPIVAPSAAALLSGLFAATERTRLQERERNRLGVVLKQYVSPQIVGAGPPTGEVTLLFTDIQGSSALSMQLGEAFEAVREEHFSILRDVARRYHGFEIETAGDSLFVVFAQATDAVQFAMEAQKALALHRWPPQVKEVKVRMGLHTGEPFVRRDRGRLIYRGPVTNRAARIMDLAQGGEVLLSDATRQAVESQLPSRFVFSERGIQRLKHDETELVWEVNMQKEPTKKME